jgi:hypothetical protein
MTVLRGAALAMHTVVILTMCSAVAEAQVDKPVSPREIEELRKKIEAETRSTLEILLGSYGENGDLNNRLDVFRYGARLELKLQSGRTASIVATRAEYATPENLLQAHGTRVAVGLRSAPTEKLGRHVELGVTRFSSGSTTVEGVASATVRPDAAARLSLEVSRTSVEESLLSSAGIRPVVGPFAGALVGRVMENRGGLSGDWRLPYRLDVFGEGSIGNRQGPNVPSNFFKRGLGGAGFNAITADEKRKLSFLRASASVFYFGFSDDRLGYGGASLLDRAYEPVPVDSLGSDGIPPEASALGPAVGGYFSPRRFVSATGRIDARGRLGPSVDYNAYVFLGRQSYTGADPRLAAGVWGQVLFRLGERLSAPLTGAWDDFGPFKRYHVLASLVVRL